MHTSPIVVKKLLKVLNIAIVDIQWRVAINVKSIVIVRRCSSQTR